MASSSYNYINLTGAIVPDTADLITQVQNEYKTAFGADLNVDPSTPQGMLIMMEVLARASVLQNNAALGNQINPNLAGGIFLDAILALTGSQRNPNTHTLVLGVVLQGVLGTIIPAGSQAKDSVTGEIYQSLDTVTLTGSPPQAAVGFTAINPGAITLAANNLTQIVTPVLGWDTVTNPNAGLPGELTQSDAAARLFRKQTIAGQGSGLPDAIISAVLKVADVQSMSFYENVTDSTITTPDGAVTLLPHSIYACVNGGTSLDVATAILSKKGGGCNYNGGVTQNVVDIASGQTYPVKFDRPTAVPIAIQVTYRSAGTVTDPVDAIKQALLDYANGNTEGQEGFVVGGNVSSFELAGAVAQEFPTIYIASLETKIIASGSFSSDEIPILINQIATLQSSAITVTPAS